MSTKKIIGVKTLIMCAALIGELHASKIVIKNDDTAKINVIVEPGEGSIVSSTPKIKRDINAGDEIVLNVTKDELGNVKTFSVKGTVTVPSIYNRCSGLFIDEDYEIVFTGAKTGGTICYAKNLVEQTKEDK